ncbi:hypothetical protein [Archangium violaceum]|uniref:hypothetical protein n=1 Tax=Archangium violaceum TaxID=83451 RepID=UPI001EF0A340|nr:hypothetical protein [Archangium violaceum]
MVTDEQRARIRRLYFAEHWKVGTIAAELGVHHDTVRGALEVERFVRTTARVRPTMLDPYRDLIAQTLAQHPKLRATRLVRDAPCSRLPGQRPPGAALRGPAPAGVLGRGLLAAVHAAG